MSAIVLVIGTAVILAAGCAAIAVLTVIATTKNKRQGGQP